MHATVCWRIGVDKFGGQGHIFTPSPQISDGPTSYMVNPNQTVSFDPGKMFDPFGISEETIRLSIEGAAADEEDWRNY